MGDVYNPKGMGKGEEAMSAHDEQVGGNHYRDMAIQPSKFIVENDLGWHEGNAVKYICRHHLKGGSQDIDKAIHYLTLLKEIVYEREASNSGAIESDRSVHPECTGTGCSQTPQLPGVCCGNCTGGAK
jgi:hypothetical protein